MPKQTNACKNQPSYSLISSNSQSTEFILTFNMNFKKIKIPQKALNTHTAVVYKYIKMTSRICAHKSDFPIS